ncbi:hypothetical protein DMENIID0001_027000 [Sergentomyia squamirostris]
MILGSEITHLTFPKRSVTNQMRVVYSFTTSILCARIPGLSHVQRALCTESPDAVVALAMGHVAGAEECQHQFRGHRWNCTQVWKKDVFGHVIVVDLMCPRNRHYHAQFLCCLPSLTSSSVAGLVAWQAMVETLDEIKKIRRKITGKVSEVCVGCCFVVVIAFN